MAVTTPTVTLKDGSGATQTGALLQDPAGVSRSVTSLDTPGVGAYRFSATFTPQATAAVTILTVTGSATKTVRIKRITLGGVSTASGSTTIALQRTTALGAGGTAVAPTQAKLDSGTVASATAVVTHYTTSLKAAGTATGIGPLSNQVVGTGITAAPSTSGIPPTFQLFPETGSLSGQAIVLRGATDFLEVQNTNAGNLPAGTVYSYMVELEEDAS